VASLLGRRWPLSERSAHEGERVAAASAATGDEPDPTVQAMIDHIDTGLYD
jgi:hypothetical protein